MIALESATGITFTDDDLIIVSVAKGLREVAVKSALIISGYRDLTPVQIAQKIERDPRFKDISRDNIILGLPRNQVVIRTVELPMEVEENLDQVTRFQVERFEPVEGALSCYDHTIVWRDESLKKIRLQMVMAPSSLVEEKLDLLKELGLSPAAVRVSGHGLQHLLTVHSDGVPKKEPVVILQLEESEAAFCLIAGKGQAYSDSARIQDEDPIEGVLRELHLFLTGLNLPNSNIAKVYLVGRLAEEHAAVLKERLGDVEVFFEKARIKSGASATTRLEQVSDSLALALSALTEKGAFNLIPKERQTFRARPSLVPTAVLAVLLVLMGSAVAARGYFQSERQLSGIERQVAELREDVARTIDLRNQIDARQAQLDELRTLLNENRRVLSVLRELTEKLPAHSYLESLSFQGNRINMTGHADKAAGLLPILEGSECFSTVQQKYIIPGRDNKEKFRFEVEIGDCPLE